MIPNQKTGADCPIRATTFPTASRIVPRLTAEKMPKGTPTTMEKIKEAKPSCRVAGKLYNDLHRWTPFRDGFAESPSQGIFKEYPVLLVIRLVQAQGYRQPVPVLLGGVIVQIDVPGVAGSPAHDEYQKGYRQQSETRHHQALKQIPLHFEYLSCLKSSDHRTVQPIYYRLALKILRWTLGGE